MHCKKGRDKGKDNKNFRKEGSLIVNENLDILNEIYKECYESR